MNLSIAAKMLEILLARDWGWLSSKTAWNFTEGKFLWRARWEVVRHLHSRFRKGIRDKSRRGVVCQGNTMRLSFSNGKILVV